MAVELPCSGFKTLLSLLTFCCRLRVPGGSADVETLDAVFNDGPAQPVHQRPAHRAYRRGG